MTDVDTVPLEHEAVDFPGIPEDVQYIRDPLDRMVALLGDIRAGLTLGQHPAAARLAFPFIQAVRFRAEMMVLKNDAAGVVTLRIGSAAFDTFPFASADTKVLSFPVIIDRGIDVALTSSAGNASGYLVGYVDEANE